METPSAPKAPNVIEVSTLELKPTVMMGLDVVLRSHLNLGFIWCICIIS